MDAPHDLEGVVSGEGSVTDQGLLGSGVVGCSGCEWGEWVLGIKVVEAIVDLLNLAVEEGAEVVAEVLGGWDVCCPYAEFGEFFDEHYARVI